MPNADVFRPRQPLTSPNLLARLLERMGAETIPQADLWHRLTEAYAVDLDALASLLPKAEPEPIWLPARD